MRSSLHSFALRKELRAVGATKSESRDLSALASQLRLLKSPGEHTYFYQNRRSVFVIASLNICIGLFVGALLVTFSQSSLPGSILYPVKKISENTAIAIDPNYRGTVMMQRAQEVQTLVADHASSRVVLATLADYRSEAMTYKSTSTNYSVFEYCKANLQQAENGATGSEQQAIQGTLSSLSDV